MVYRTLFWGRQARDAAVIGGRAGAGYWPRGVRLLRLHAGKLSYALTAARRLRARRRP